MASLVNCLAWWLHFVPLLLIHVTSVPVCLFSPLVPLHLVSPLQFQVEFANYPNQTAVADILNGPQNGFHIGFEALSVSLRSASSNMFSAFDHPSVIDAYL